jgi:single-strand DNA-binding protein
MSMVNVSLVGNLARAPEQICFASGKIKTILVIAVSAAQKKQEQQKGNETAADFYRIETWGKLAELAQKYLNKGNQVGVSGRLIMEHWVDRNGQQRLTPVVSATQLSFPPRVSVAANDNSEKAVLRSVPDSAEIEAAATEAEDENLEEDLMSGAKVITVAEPPPHYYVGSSPYRTHRSTPRRAAI